MTVRTAGLLVATALFALSVLQAGCNPKAADSTSGGTDATTPATTSPFDKGPRANTIAADPAKAVKGKALFSAKGCTACHGFGQRMAGPDLKGVTGRRTEEWMTHWLTAPDEMQKSDAIARQLLAEFPTQMPNLHLTPDEVAQLIDYLRLQDKTLGATQ